MRVFTAVVALRRLRWRKARVPLAFLAVALTCGDQDECLWRDTPRYFAVQCILQSRRVWYAELGIAVPSACRWLYDVVQCQDVNKTMNYSVHHGDAGLRAAFR